MIGLRLDVPIACWRRGAAREFLETEVVPPPSTCYGSLLSLVGETDADRHRGCRVTSGLVGTPLKSVVFRSLWQVKDKEVPRGNGANIGPDFQELLTEVTVLVWCNGSSEQGPDTLEERVRRALAHPEGVTRFGGWALGDSTHLINSVGELETAKPPAGARAFLLDAAGSLTLPVWVDHVGSKGTRYAVGRLQAIDRAPVPEELPQIPLS
jgi:CRISPR-associated protein Cas5t